MVVVETGTRIRWSVTRDGEPLIGPVSSALTVNGRALGRAPARRAERAQADDVIQAIFCPRRELVRDRYEQLTLMFADDLRFIESARRRLMVNVHGSYGPPTRCRSSWRPEEAGWDGSCRLTPGDHFLRDERAA